MKQTYLVMTSVRASCDFRGSIFESLRSAISRILLVISVFFVEIPSFPTLEVDGATNRSLIAIL